MLTKEELHGFQQALLEEKKRLEAELSTFTEKNEKGEYIAKYQDFGSDEDDNAEEYRQHEVSLSLEKSLEGALNDVNTALEKFESGSYGVCEVCGESIQIERLKAFPAARMCMQHA